MTYQLSWGADLRRHFYNSCTRLTIYAVGVLVSVCVCGDAAAVSVSDLEFVSMFPSARGECFNGDVATLECSQVENGERRLERLRLRVLSATIRIRIRIKRGRLPVPPLLLQWSTSQARVWTALCAAFALISLLMKSRTAHTLSPSLLSLYSQRIIYIYLNFNCNDSQLESHAYISQIFLSVSFLSRTSIIIDQPRRGCARIWRDLQCGLPHTNPDVMINAFLNAF